MVSVRPECGSFAFRGSSASIRLILWSGMRARGVGVPGLGIDAVEFGGLNQCVGDCRGFAAGLRSLKAVVLAARSGGAHRAFGARRAPVFLNQWRTIPRFWSVSDKSVTRFCRLTRVKTKG